MKRAVSSKYSSVLLEMWRRNVKGPDSADIYICSTAVMTVSVTNSVELAPYLVQHKLYIRIRQQVPFLSRE